MRRREDEFFALAHGLMRVLKEEEKRSGKRPGLRRALDESSIHGRLGAQVALLQSPIPRAVLKP